MTEENAPVEQSTVDAVAELLDVDGKAKKREPDVHLETPEEEEGDDSGEPDEAADGDGGSDDAGNEDDSGESEAWSLDRIEDEDDWSESPEKVKSAAGYLQEQARKLHKHWGVSEKRRQRVEQREADLRTTVKEVTAYRDALMANVRALRAGNADDRLRALAQLTNQRADQVLEELVTGIATDGKGAGDQPSPELRALQEQVKQLTDHIRQQGRQGQDQQLQAVLRKAVRDADRWPTLVEQAKADPDAAAQQVYQYALERKLTVGAACNAIELELLRAEKSKRTEAVEEPEPRKIKRTAGKPKPKPPVLRRNYLEEAAGLIGD